MEKVLITEDSVDYSGIINSKKKVYHAPMSHALQFSAEHFFCATVDHNAAGSIEESWNDNQVEAGEIEL
jgi:hypothetical protein